MYDYKIFKTIANYTVIIFQHGQFRNRTIVRQTGFVAEWQAQKFAEREIEILTGKAQEFANDPITRSLGL